MAEEPENLTLRLLQEMRTESSRRADAMEQRFTEMEKRFTDLVQRIDGNTLVFNLVAGVVHDHEQRIGALESKSS